MSIPFVPSYPEVNFDLWGDIYYQYTYHDTSVAGLDLDGDGTADNSIIPWNNNTEVLWREFFTSLDIPECLYDSYRDFYRDEFGVFLQKWFNTFLTHSGKASTPANSLKSTHFPSITGIPARAPIFPSPSTADPSVITATILARAVYLYEAAESFSIILQGSATPGV